MKSNINTDVEKMIMASSPMRISSTIDLDNKPFTLSQYHILHSPVA